MVRCDDVSPRLRLDAIIFTLWLLYSYSIDGVSFFFTSDNMIFGCEVTAVMCEVIVELEVISSHN